MNSLMKFLLPCRIREQCHYNNIDFSYNNHSQSFVHISTKLTHLSIIKIGLAEGKKKIAKADTHTIKHLHSLEEPIPTCLQHLMISQALISDSAHFQKRSVNATWKG